MSPTTVAQVLTRMRDIASDLPASDGAGVFNGVYLKVTEMMRDRLSTGGVFRDNAFITDLDVRFADYWFSAYDAPRDKPKAWDPLFTARANTQILPIQFALAGMNTHIENDLPLAVVATCTARGRAPDSPGVHEDYDTVNERAGQRRSRNSAVISERSRKIHRQPLRTRHAPHHLVGHREGPRLRVADRKNAVGTTTGQPAVRCIRRNTQQHGRNGLSAAADPGNPVVPPAHLVGSSANISPR